ncbi:sensor histidine kinase [Chryseobacterium oryzae]|uniref:Sensor histidine kinase n=1 Tax=Chryseobacterium oryzae TaxID=2929799 RepID=A0ABY4BEI4_9FLAO|nr:sensor histidine kinase [Chryseobacterium oryzae]UOE37565.1 sensor histidine kinase [Chryseobacterium oryzae]
MTNENVHIIDVLAMSLPLILFFYLCVYGFSLSSKSKVLMAIYFLGISVSLFGGGYLLIDNVFPRFGINIKSDSFSFAAYSQEVIIATFKFFVYALLYFVIVEWLKTQQNLKNSELERLKIDDLKNKKELETIKYQYAFLRTQINPHFLYNTLNVLFSQALKVSQPLAENILKLSDVMRYALDNSDENNGKVLVQKELDHLQRVIDIQQMRFSDRKQISFKINGEIKDQKIPPLSFITLVENAFKYGDLNDPEHPLEIKISVTEKIVCLKLKNKKRKTSSEIVSNNIGINNLRQRLDHAFPQKYKLSIQNEQNFYHLQLEIRQ